MGDRFSKAKIMYVCDFLKGGLIVLATALMLLFPKPRTHVAILFTLGILGSAVSGIFTPASGALLPHIVEEDRLQQANAYFSVKSSLEGILGIVLAGFLYAALPIHTLFFLVGACFIASGVSETLIRYRHEPSPERLTISLALRDMADGMAYLRTKKAIMALLAAILFINFFFTPVTGNFLPFFVKKDLAGAPGYLLDGVLSPEMWSSVFSACFGISSLIAAAILSARPQEDKCGRKTSLRLCAVAAAMIGLTVSYCLFVDAGLSMNAFLITLCLGSLAMGAMISFINIPFSTVMMRIVDRDKLSKVNSIMSIGSQGMVPIASLLAGAILDTLGSTVLLAACSLGFAVTAALMLTSKRIREF